MKKVMELPTNQSSVSKRTKKENISSVSTPKVSKAEKLREQKEREFDMYLKYIKNYPLENHLMMWFEKNFPHPEFVGDLVEEINDVIWEMIKDYSLEHNVKPVKKKLMSERTGMFS